MKAGVTPPVGGGFKRTPSPRTIPKPAPPAKPKPPPPPKTLAEALIASLIPATPAPRRFDGLPVLVLLQLIEQYLILTPLTVSTIPGSGVRPARHDAGQPNQTQKCILFPRAGAVAGGRLEYDLLLFDDESHQIYSLRPETGGVSLWAGRPPRTSRHGDRSHTPKPVSALEAELVSPYECCLDPSTNSLLVVERGSAHRISRIRNGVLSHVAGDPNLNIGDYRDSHGVGAYFFNPSGIVCAANGSFAIVADSDNNAIRRIRLKSEFVETSTIVGAARTPRNVDGVKPKASIRHPTALTWDGDSQQRAVYVLASPSVLRRLDITTGELTTLRYSPGKLVFETLLWAGTSKLLAATRDQICSITIRTPASKSGGGEKPVSLTCPVTVLCGISLPFDEPDRKSVTDGSVSSATFSRITSLALLPAGNHFGGSSDQLFVTDLNFTTIRVITGSVVGAL